MFSSSLRLKEQVDIVAKSKAWAKLKEIPVVQQGILGAQLWYGMAATEWNQTLQKPENQQLIDLVADLFSHEIVWYADQQTADLVGLAEDVYNSAVYNPSAFNPQQAGNPQQNDPKAAARGALKRLSSNLDKLKIPTIVLAFKHTDAARAKAQLARLEKAAGDAIAANPDFKGHFQRSTVAGNDYLTLKLDGKMISWDEILADAADVEEKPGQLKQVVDRLKQLETVISIGVRGDYLLISLAPFDRTSGRLGNRCAFGRARGIPSALQTGRQTIGRNQLPEQRGRRRVVEPRCVRQSRRNDRRRDGRSRNEARIASSRPR